MDYMAVQQKKLWLETGIFNSIRDFEKATEREVEEIIVTRLDGIKKATGIKVKLKGYMDGS